MSETSKGNTLFVLTFFLVMTLGLFVFAASPRGVGDQVVVFVSPWTDQSQAIHVIAAAEGAFLRGGSRHWIALAKSDDPSFVSRLYQSGAIFVGNGEAFSACFSKPAPYELKQI